MPTGRSPPDKGARRRTDRPRRKLAWTLSIAAHLAALAAFFWVGRPPPADVDEPPVQVSLVNLQPADAPAPAPAAAAPAPVQPVPPPSHVRPTPVRADVETAPLAPSPKPQTSDVLSEAQLAGAASADSGGAGGGGNGAGTCDMARTLQRALRRDPLVQNAVVDAHREGKAILVWNGDWVRSGEEDGKGLAAVREAIMWEIAFAPEACKLQRVHGLVLLSLNDGFTRLAVGSGEWRWSDLLAPTATLRDR